MAPHVGFNTEHIRDKARKDLLYLLEAVSPSLPRPTRLGEVRRQTDNLGIRRSVERRTWS